MIPLRVEAPLYSRPKVLPVLIAANVAVFLLMKSGGDAEFQRRVFQYSAVPRNLFHEPTTTYFSDGPRGAPSARAAGRAPGRRPPFDDRRILRKIERAAPTSDKPIPVGLILMTADGRSETIDKLAPVRPAVGRRRGALDLPQD